MNERENAQKREEEGRAHHFESEISKKTKIREKQIKNIVQTNSYTHINTPTNRKYRFVCCLLVKYMIGNKNRGKYMYEEMII